MNAYRVTSVVLKEDGINQVVLQGIDPMVVGVVTDCYPATGVQRPKVSVRTKLVEIDQDCRHDRCALSFLVVRGDDVFYNCGAFAGPIGTVLDENGNSLHVFRV